MEFTSTLESGSPIALFAPHQLLVEAFSEIDKVHIYRQDGRQNWSHNKNLINQFGFADHPKANESLDFILERLRSSEPIFTRHYENLVDLEKAYREVSLIVLSLSNDLARHSIAAVIFPTMSSHHLDSLVMEIACQINDIPQIFQYIPVVANRCLPIVQRMNIEDRQLLSKIVKTPTNSSWHPKISTMNWRAPITASTEICKSNLYQSIFSICIYQFRTILRKFRKVCWSYISGLFKSENSSTLIKKNEDKSRALLKPISLWQDIKLMRVHHDSLNSLDLFISTDASYISEYLKNKPESSNPLIVIAANFQPEATSFPEAGKIYNFIDLVILMRSLGIKGPILYKEHPATRFIAVGHKSTRCGVSRSVSYYTALKSLGVYFLNSGFDLSTSKSIIPLTLNGSIAIERSLRGLPTILTGSPWFAGMPGTCTLNKFIESPKKFSSIDSQETSSLAADFINDIMKFSMSIEPILYGHHTSNQTQITDFIEEYGNFLIAVQEISV
jgi:hypothetical protein